MASVNPFDLLVDDDNDDPSQLIAKKAALAPTSAPPSQQQPKAQAKLPSKPVPPAQAVRETKSDGRGAGRGGRGYDGRGRARNTSSGGGREGGYGGGREGGYGGGGREGGYGGVRDGGYGGGRDGGYGGGRDGGYGGGRDGGYGGGRDGGFNRDRSNNENSFSNNGSAGFVSTEEGDVEKSSGRGGGGRGPFRGRRGGFNNGEVDGERPRRTFERRSGTGRGNELKREGSGKGNWGSATDEIAPETEEQTPANEKSVTAEKQPGEEEAADASKENPVNEPEEKEMTLDEYTKILEEKRKALQALKGEERKVTVDKEFESMQLLSGKKTNDEIFAKLGSEKDKRKEIADKDEKTKKSVSINEFLKPAGGDKYYSPGGRGRGRGRGARGGGGYSGGNTNVTAPSIEDPTLFPNLKKT